MKTWYHPFSSSWSDLHHEISESLGGVNFGVKRNIHFQHSGCNITKYHIFMCQRMASLKGVISAGSVYCSFLFETVDIALNVLPLVVINQLLIIENLELSI